MKLFRGWILLLVVGVLASSFLVARPKSDRFSYGDVPRVMSKLLDLHVDKTEMTPEILRRSFESYIDHFDSQRLYLTQAEVNRYTQMSDGQLQAVLERYKRGDVSDFAQLNRFLEQAVVRSRQWRTELRVEVERWIAEGRTADARVLDKRTEYEADETALRERMGDLMLWFALYEMERFPQLKSDDLDRVWVLYEKRLRGVENDYLLADMSGNPLNAKDAENLLTLRIVKAMAHSLDSHTDVFSPEEAYELRLHLMKGFTGVGIVLEEGLDGVVVTRLVEGGPADRSGKVQLNDRLVEVNGRAVALYPFRKVMDFIRGENGSQITLGLSRLSDEGKEEYVQVVLTREPVVMKENRVKISYEHVEGGIVAMISLDSFYESGGGVSSSNDLKRSIRELEKIAPLKGLILDMRQNLGGFLSQSVKVSSLFISSGIVAIAKYSDGSTLYFRDVDGTTAYDGPLVVLTSKASASAAEIVAQALQDYGRAVVVGDERTYGKGSIQSQTVTDDSADLYYKVTVGRYYTVSGKGTQIDGVKADIVVPSVLHDDPVGEEFIQYPLPADRVAAQFNDTLSDLDPIARHWLAKYYVPTIQKRSDFWARHMELLRTRSQQRLERSPEYAKFLEESQQIGVQGFSKWVSEHKDIQSTEAFNIVKDMVVIEQRAQPTS